MKIDFAMWTTHCTGGVKELFKLMNDLVEKGHEISISAVSGDHNWFPLKKEIKVDYVPKPFRFAGRFTRVLGAPFLFSLIKRKKVDVNIATFCLNAFAVAKYGQGKKKFYWVLGYEPSYCNNPIFKYIARKSLNLPLHMVVNSSWLKNKIKNEIGKDLEIIHHKNISQFRQKKVKKNPYIKRIVCLSKPVKRKGIDDMFKAFEIILKQRKDVELVLYGYPHKRKNTPPHVFKGVVAGEDLVDLINSADVVVCPSWLESFPLPPVEAMACGIPVVTTNCGVEDYAVNEKNCLVVELKQPEQLAKAVLKVLSDENFAKNLVKEGLKTVGKFKIEWKNAVNRFNELLMR